MATSIQKVINEFLKHLRQSNGSSQATINNYRFYLQRFVQWGHVASIHDISKNSIENFRMYLSGIRNQRGQLMKPITQNYHLIAIRALLEYCKQQGINALHTNEVTLLKAKRSKKITPRKTDLERLLDAPLHTNNSEVLQKRDKAILELLFTSGLKVSELSALRKNQILFFKDELQIRGLGNVIRTVPLTNQAKYWIKEYIQERSDNQAALFIRHDKAKQKQSKTADAHLTPRTIQRIVKKYVEKTGLDSTITPESLRRSFAAELIKQGNDMKAVKEALGHASLTTTQYLYK